MEWKLHIPPSLQELCLPMCLAKITSSLSVTNFWTVRRQLMFPWYANFRSIKFVIDAFICDHFIEISQTDQILTLDEEEMHWLFDNQDIKACEATMLHCLVRWYQHQQSGREKVFKDLFPKIHLSMIPMKYLWSVIKKYELLKVMPELIEYEQSKCVELSDEALHKQYLGNIAVITAEAVPQLSFDSDDENIRIILELPFTRILFPLSIFPIFPNFVILPSSINLEFFSKTETFVLGQKLFVFLESSTIYWYGVSSIRGYSFKLDNTISSCHPCPERIKTWILSINCGMYIFFLGCYSGFDFWERYIEPNTVYRYDTVNDEWKEMAPMIYRVCTGRPKPLILCYNDRYIFIFDNQHSKKYDIYTNKWSVIRPMPAGMICCNGRQVGNKIFIFYYGHKPRMVSKCFNYDPLSDTWEELKNLNDLDRLILRNSLLDLQSFFGKVFVLSQYYYHDFVNTISEINLQERKMKKLRARDSHYHKRYSNTHMAMLSRGMLVNMVSRNVLLLCPKK